MILTWYRVYGIYKVSVIYKQKEDPSVYVAFWARSLSRQLAYGKRSHLGLREDVDPHRDTCHGYNDLRAVCGAKPRSADDAELFVVSRLQLPRKYLDLKSM